MAQESADNSSSMVERQTCARTATPEHNIPSVKNVKRSYALLKTLKYDRQHNSSVVCKYISEFVHCILCKHQDYTYAGKYLFYRFQDLNIEKSFFMCFQMVNKSFQIVVDLKVSRKIKIQTCHQI